MSSLVLSGDTSGTVSLSVPAVAGSNTLTIQAGTGTNSMNTRATAVATTSGTSIDFTGLPDWVKRITVMFNGVSTNGSSIILIQIGSGSVTTTGYTSQCSAGGAGVQSTAGFLINTASLSTISYYGQEIITNISSNSWVASGIFVPNTTSTNYQNGGAVGLSGTLDRVRITTVNGTDTFDAGSINILYE